jgi:hypothetical protein
VLPLRLTEGRSRSTVDEARRALRDVHFVETAVPFRRQLRRTTLLDDDNGKPLDRLVEDLGRVAELGWNLWTLLLQDQDEWWAPLREPATIQVSRAAGTAFVFPWALVYDIPLLSHEAWRPCSLLDTEAGLRRALDGFPRRCPREADHGPNVLCPFGFWGYRHVFEQPPSAPSGSGLARSVGMTNEPPRLVAGLSRRLSADLTDRHLAALRSGLPGFVLHDHDSKDAVRDALREPVELVYFYCHGGMEPMARSGLPVPYLEVGEHDRLQPGDLLGWRVGSWPADHWREQSPLVFINGCRTAELTPELLVNFVDGFSAARAAGVIGTEIPLSQAVAGEAAERFFRHFRVSRSGVGAALLRMRLELLAKGNLLGLAYTPYCSADLRLARPG